MIINDPANIACLRSCHVQNPKDEVPYGLACTIEKTRICSEGIYIEVKAFKNIQFKAYHFSLMEPQMGPGGFTKPTLYIYLHAKGTESDSSELYHFVIPKEDLPDFKDIIILRFFTRRLVPYKVVNVNLHHQLCPATLGKSYL